MLKFLQSPSTWVVGVLILGVSAMLFERPTSEPTGRRTAMRSKASIVVPNFSQAARAGQVAFEGTCAACHGKNASGTSNGPPLVHDIYNPGHHDDASIRRAIRLGTRQHHWPFGNMPPQPNVTGEQLEQIVSYVRELQQANGIRYRPHRM